MISDEDKERVRQATDFVSLVSETVELRRRGKDLWGCCPFHQEKSPSFHIDPATGLWKCFGCQRGGDVFNYVMEREHLEFPDAIRFLADRAGIELAEERGVRKGPKRNRLQQALGEAEAYYATMLMRGRGAGPQAARNYLASRGFGSAVCRRWGLGFAPGHGALTSALMQKGYRVDELLAADVAVERSGRLQDRFYDRVMFPIHDEQGRSLAFGGRVLGDAKPKYLNTKETSIFHKSKHLFGLDHAKSSITATGVALVVEGYTDVIALHEHGFTQAVAALGTALSLEHIKMLSRYRARRIICMFDGDAAGQKAAELSVQFIDKTDAEMLCVVLPDNLDPMEFLSTHSSQELQAQLDAARPLMDFVVEKKLAGFDLGIPGQRALALEAVARVLAPLIHSVSFSAYATNLAHSLDMDVEATKQAIRDVAARMAAREAQFAQRESPYDTESAGAFAESTRSYYAGDKSVSSSASTEAFPRSAYVSLDKLLSHDARAQLAAERELLALLTNSAAAVRPYAERLAALSWADSRHEAMAWAMLATDGSATPAELVNAASHVVPEAPQILAGGGLTLAQGMDDQQKAAFLADVLELYSTRREIKSIQAQLSEHPDEHNLSELLGRAAKLRKRERELNQIIPREV